MITRDQIRTHCADMTVDEAMTWFDTPVIVRQPVAVERVKAWAVRQITPDGAFLLRRLKTVASDPDHLASDLADALLEAVGLNMPAWEMDHPDIVSMMAAAIQAGLLRQAQIDELRTLADTEVPRWQELGLSRPLRWQIEEALA